MFKTKAKWHVTIFLFRRHTKVCHTDTYRLSSSHSSRLCSGCRLFPLYPQYTKTWKLIARKAPPHPTATTAALFPLLATWQIVLGLQGSNQQNFTATLGLQCSAKNPSKPHCGKTENAADLSAWSAFTRQRRFFFPIQTSWLSGRKEGSQSRRKGTAWEVIRIKRKFSFTLFLLLWVHRGSRAITNNRFTLAVSDKPNCLLKILICNKINK